MTIINKLRIKKLGREVVKLEQEAAELSRKCEVDCTNGLELDFVRWQIRERENIISNLKKGA